MGRTTYGFFIDIGFSPRQVLPNPNATDMWSQAYAEPTPPPWETNPPPRERESRGQRRDREWRERCRRRDQERAEQAATAGTTEDAPTTQPGDLPESDGTAAVPSSDAVDEPAEKAKEPSEPETWATLVQADTETVMEALDREMEGQ